MLDAREALLEALAELEAPEPHRHSWLEVCTIKGERIFDCGCGERRRVQPGETRPLDELPSDIKPGGAIRNWLQAEYQGPDPQPW